MYELVQQRTSVGLEIINEYNGWAYGGYGKLEVRRGGTPVYSVAVEVEHPGGRRIQHDPK